MQEIQTKENKGSNLIQLRVSDKTKSQLDKLAERTGFNLNAYLYHLIAQAIEKNKLN